MLPTPVRRRALDYFLGVGGSGRRPVESADPRGPGVAVDLKDVELVTRNEIVGSRR